MEKIITDVTTDKFEKLAELKVLYAGVTPEDPRFTEHEEQVAAVKQATEAEKASRIKTAQEKLSKKKAQV